MIDDEKEDQIDRGIDDQMRRIKTGLEAEEAWSDTACRIADALEHMVISQSLMALQAMGKLPTSMPKPQHRTDCPACALAKSATLAHNVSAIAKPGTGILAPNGKKLH
jgi:hypothetical protein